MDATNQKTLASGLVLLMLGSLFAGLAIAPVASAQVTNPTGFPDIIVNASQRRTEFFDVDADGTAEEAGDIAIVTSGPTGGIIYADTRYDFTIEGLVAAPGGYAYLGTATAVYILNTTSGAAISGGVQGTYTTGGPFRAATFGDITFPDPGVYSVRASSETGALVAQVFVQPSPTFAVSVSPNSFTWSLTGATYTVTVTDEATGAGFEGAMLSGANIQPGTVTSSGGTRTIIGTLPGAGTFPIQATLQRTWAGGPSFFGGKFLPSVRDNATLTVTGATLNMTAVATTAFVGFSNEISFRPSFADTNEIVGQKTNTLPLRTEIQDATDWINVSVTAPGGFMMWRNISNPQTTLPTSTTTAGTAFDLTAGMLCANLTSGTVLGTVACSSIPGNPTPALWTLNTATGNIAFRPGDGDTNVWAGGTYSFNVGVNSAGATGTPPEYTGTFGVTPATPAAVNLEFMILSPTSNQLSTAPSDRDPAPGTLDVLAPNPTVGGGATGATPTLQGYMLDLRISGHVSTQHPNCATAPCTDFFGGTTFVAGNVTLRGDLLPGWTIGLYDPASGSQIISGVQPTRNGTIWIDVNWKNVTTTLAIPVVRGANVTADLTNMTVDTTNTLSVTVRAATGGAEPSAYVRVFQRDANGGAFQGTGTSEISGNNVAGSGLNGQYTFTLNPSIVQDLVVFAMVGSGAAQNYSYWKLDVLPNQATNITLNRTETMASLKTQFVLNATNATQAFTSGVNFRTYFLLAADRLDLVNNGTTSLFDGTPAIGNCGASATAASCLVVPDSSTAFGSVFNLTLQPRDWYVYFCSGFGTGADCTTATRDNRLSMPVVNVTSYTATVTPNQIASSADIQANQVVNIQVTDRDGQPANGTVTISAGSAATTGGTSATITNGQGNITLTGGGAVGTVWFDFDPTDPGGQVAQASRLEGNLSVIAGNLTFSPSRVPILQSTLVTIRLANFTGGGLPGRVIRICGTSLNSQWPATVGTTNANPPATLATADINACSNVGTTESDGSTGIVVTPTALNALHVYINNSWTQRQIPVTAGTLTVTVNPTSPQAGGNATFTVTQPGNVPSVGARVLVTRNGTTVLDSTADGNGQATLSNLATGSYVVTAIRTGYDNGTASFTVGPTTPVANATFELRNLVLPDRINVGQPVTVQVTVVNTGTASATANALLLVNGAQRSSQSVTLAGGANQTVAYEFTPTVAGTYAVSVRIGDVTIGPQNIVVGTPTPTTPTVTGTPTVSPPTVTGTPTVTTPPPTGTPSPIVTPTATPEPTVPGFEVVALLAALGVAMLVLRRRT